MTRYVAQSQIGAAASLQARRADIFIEIPTDTFTKLQRSGTRVPAPIQRKIIEREWWPQRTGRKKGREFELRMDVNSRE